MRGALLQSLLLVVVGSACTDPIEGQPDDTPDPPAFLSTVVERGFFVDVQGTYRGLTLIVDQDQPHLFYVNRELWEVRYAGCYARCDEERFWVRGTVDTTVWALFQDAGGAAGLDAGGTLHVLFGRRFYARCRGLCNAASSWTSARIDTAWTANLSLAVAPTGRLHALSIIPGLVFPVDPFQVEYATCAAACTDSANWQHAIIGADAKTMFPTKGTAIIRDAVDRLHVTFMTEAGGVIALRYGTCAASCLDPQSWSFAVVDSGPNQFVFGLASTAGGVDLVYAPFFPPGPVQYATCSVNCASNSAWHRTTLGTLPGPSDPLLAAPSDAAIAASATGVRAIAVGGYGISVWRCTAACGSATSWETFRLDQLEGNDSAFHRVEEVSIGLDPADQPVVARYGWGVVKYFRRNY